MVVMHARSGFNLIPRLSHTQIKKWGKPGSIHYVNDVRWTLGGHREVVGSADPGSVHYPVGKVSSLHC